MIKNSNLWEGGWVNQTDASNFLPSMNTTLIKSYLQHKCEDYQSVKWGTIPFRVEFTVLTLPNIDLPKMTLL